jgi:hypothetical protein
MKLAQHTARLPLIDHTSALPPPARIARPILPTSDIGSRFCRRCTAHAGREVPSAVGVAVRELEGGVRTGLSRSYSNGSRASNRSWGRHGVMRLDRVADPNQVPEFCVGPVTNCAIGGWLRCRRTVGGAAARRIWISLGLSSLSSEKGDGQLLQAGKAAKAGGNAVSGRVAKRWSSKEQVQHEEPAESF